MSSGGTSRACAIFGTAVFRMVVSSDSMKNPTATSQGKSRLAASVSSRFPAVWVGAAIQREPRVLIRQRSVDDGLRVAQDLGQMPGIAEALGVNLVDILGARRSCGEPTALRAYLDAADRRIVPGRARQHFLDALSGELRHADLRSIQLGELFLLLGSRGRLDAIGEGLAQIAHQGTVRLGGIAAVPRGDLGRKQARRDAVLVSAPRSAVEPQERSARAFLAAEAEIPRLEAGHEPLETHRHLVQRALEARRHAIDQGARDDGLADTGALLPL